MENPCLTFVAPSIIAGDKSLASVVIHEISHSWTGNLVTMNQWSDFWINEGYTMFLQRKIFEKLYNKDRALISAQSGLKTLAEDIRSIGESHEFTKLHYNIIGRTPEDAFNEVPYEKGYNFLYYLENLLNSSKPKERIDDLFQNFTQKYIKNFSYQSIDYKDFIEFFKKFLKEILPEKEKEILAQIDFDSWLFSTGMPLKSNNFTNDLSKQADKFFDEYKNEQLNISQFNPIFIEWHSDVKEYFLKKIIELGCILTENQYSILVNNLTLYTGYNADINCNFFTIMLTNKKLDKLNDMDQFLGTYRRLKYA